MNYAPGVPATLAKDGGRVASPTGAAGEGPGRTMVMAVPTPENLEHLARLLADGTLRVHVQATYELAQAPDALTALPHYAHPGQARHPRPVIPDVYRCILGSCVGSEYMVGQP